MSKHSSPPQSITDRVKQPTPEDVRELRKLMGLTQEQAALLVSPAKTKPYRTWQCYEAPVGTTGHRAIPLAAWELLLLLAGEHPYWTLAKRPKKSPETA